MTAIFPVAAAGALGSACAQAAGTIKSMASAAIPAFRIFILAPRYESFGKLQTCDYSEPTLNRSIGIGTKSLSFVRIYSRTQTCLLIPMRQARPQLAETYLIFHLPLTHPSAPSLSGQRGKGISNNRPFA